MTGCGYYCNAGNNNDNDSVKKVMRQLLSNEVISFEIPLIPLELLE